MTFLKKLLLSAVVLMTAFILTSCGGGGGNSGTGGATGQSVAITAFGFTAADNSVLSADVTGVISGTDIAVTVPYGTASIAKLVATFTTTGTSVKIGTVEQTSGTTANDFTSSKTYTVTGTDGSTRSYTVTVTVALASSKEITAFSFPAVTWTGDKTINAYGTTISGTAITVILPYVSTAASMVASFTTTGASVKIGSTEQTSGTTANDFSSSKTYTVTAADGSTQDYTVTVLFAPAVNSGWNTMNGGKLSTYWVVYDKISVEASDINPVFRCDAINAGSDNFTMIIFNGMMNCSGSYFLPYNLSAEGATITQYDNYIKIVAPLNVIQTLINKITLIPPNVFATEYPSGGCEIYITLEDKNGLYSKGISYLDVY